jgi:hypothetical protein
MLKNWPVWFGFGFISKKIKNQAKTKKTKSNQKNQAKPKKLSQTKKTEPKPRKSEKPSQINLNRFLTKLTCLIRF